MEDHLILAIRASLKAGEEILRIYEGENFEVESKKDHSPLTTADKAANKVIVEFLETSNIPVISEETKLVPYETRKSWISTWIVDPLDGTKEFIKRNGEFTVNIALVKSGVPILGVIYVPVQKILYVGIVDQKLAYKVKIAPELELNENLKNKIPIKPSKDPEAIRAVGSRSHMNERTGDFINSLKEKYHQPVMIVPKGSSLKLCLVAEGNADVYPRFGPTMEWDTAAGQAICSAAGLKVIDMVTNEPLKYNKEDLLNNNFLVSNL